MEASKRSLPLMLGNALAGLEDGGVSSISEDTVLLAVLEDCRLVDEEASRNGSERIVGGDERGDEEKPRGGDDRGELKSE